MFGLIVAVIYAACVYFMGAPNAVAEVWLSATNLLFWWYVITSAIMGVILVLAALGFSGIATTIGALERGPLGGILGFLTGGVHSLVALVSFVIKAGFSIGGVYLLHNSLAISSTGVAEWDMVKLVSGVILFLAGLIISRSSSK